MELVRGLFLVSVLLAAATVPIHAFGTTYWIRHLQNRFVGAEGEFKTRWALPNVTWTAVVLMLLHFIEVTVWAFAYLVLLPGDRLNTFEEAMYFSIVTFTTLGYGDITLVEHDWRLLRGIEALNGTLLVGWTRALLFLVVQRSWMVREQGHSKQ